MVAGGIHCLVWSEQLSMAVLVMFHLCFLVLVKVMFLTLSQSLSMIIMFPFLSIMFIDLNNRASYLE